MNCGKCGRKILVGEVLAPLPTCGECGKQSIEQEEAKRLLEALLKRSSLAFGWHGNPSNHTLEVSLYFGSKDPQHLVHMDEHGHAKLTMEILKFLAEG